MHCPYLPPLPEAQTKMLPLPLRPVETPCTKARAASRPGPSTVLPSSSGPQLMMGVKSDVSTEPFFHRGTLINNDTSNQSTESGLNKYGAYFRMFISALFLGYLIAQCILGQVLRAVSKCIFASGITGREGRGREGGGREKVEVMLEQRKG